MVDCLDHDTCISNYPLKNFQLQTNSKLNSKQRTGHVYCILDIAEIVVPDLSRSSGD